MTMRSTLRRSVACATVAILATASVPSPAEAHDVRKVRRAIRRAWGGNDRRAIRVARCESSLDPKATSPTGKYLGLWQFDRTTWKEYGGRGNDPRRVGARGQTRIAYRLYRDRGWQPWPTCGASSAARSADDWGPDRTDVRRRRR